MFPFPIIPTNYGIVDSSIEVLSFQGFSGSWPNSSGGGGGGIRGGTPSPETYAVSHNNVNLGIADPDKLILVAATYYSSLGNGLSELWASGIEFDTIGSGAVDSQPGTDPPFNPVLSNGRGIRVGWANIPSTTANFGLYFSGPGGINSNYGLAVLALRKVKNLTPTDTLQSDSGNITVLNKGLIFGAARRSSSITFTGITEVMDSFGFNGLGVAYDVDVPANANKAISTNGDYFCAVSFR